MRSRFVSAARAALMVVALSTTVESASAQGNGQALVYCPVGVDDAACNAIVNALAPLYLGGVDKGYDGSGGTINLATADLGVYSVFVVPSLADGANAAPSGTRPPPRRRARRSTAFASCPRSPMAPTRRRTERFAIRRSRTGCTTSSSVA